MSNAVAFVQHLSSFHQAPRGAKGVHNAAPADSVGRSLHAVFQLMSAFFISSSNDLPFQGLLGSVSN